MNAKKIITTVLILFVLGSLVYLFLNEKKSPAVNPAGSDGKTVNESGEVKTAAPENSVAPENGSSSRKKADRLIVYYFYNNVRCASCLKIEKYTKSSLEENFAGKLKDGDVEWIMLNVDEPENKHFVDDYKLITKSVVLSEIKDGKEIAHKNLDKVWELLGDEDIFKKYITGEIKDFSGGKV